jgi:hypothetical protein
MHGITAKEKQTPPAATTPRAVPPQAPTQIPPVPAPDEKGMYEYSEEFKKKYGGRKPA